MAFPLFFGRKSLKLVLASECWARPRAWICSVPWFQPGAERLSVSQLRRWDNRDFHGGSICKTDGECDLSHRPQTSFPGRVFGLHSDLGLNY
jgi:hypothetical protein